MSQKLIVLLILSVASLFSTCVMALAPNNVLVVYNTASSIRNESQAVANYYANARNIPSTNVVGIFTFATEHVSLVQYIDSIATPISNYLSTHPNIKCIVLCYGIPSWIIYQPNYDMSVDSALTLLGNPGVPNAQGEFARQPGD